MLILASHSPARRALLQGAGLVFAVHPANIDERLIEAEHKSAHNDPGGLAKHLARAKAERVSFNHPGALVIGADQTLVLNGKYFHKPKDRAAAFHQLGLLSGHTHTLTAGIALARAGRTVWAHTQTARLTMRANTDQDIGDSLDRDGAKACDSVGGYRLEGPSIRLFERIEGDYFTILGLPLIALLSALRQFAPDEFSKRPAS